MGQFSVSACANQASSFSVSGTTTPNGLFQTIKGLKRLMGYLIGEKKAGKSD